MTFVRRHLSPAAALLLATLVVGVTAPVVAARAQSFDASGSPEVIEAAPDPSGPDTGDSRAGAVAAMACGFFARLSTAPGGPYTGAIVGAVASCLYMVVDALFFDPPTK
jgi:hypothetical protein